MSEAGGDEIKKLLEQGETAHDEGDLEQAAQAYRSVLEADPRHTIAQNNLGMVLIDQGEMDTAVECFRSAIGFDPEHAEAYNNLGYVLRRQGENEAAAEAWLSQSSLSERALEQARDATLPTYLPKVSPR